ncbi:MAG: hypothetical protein L0220_12120 [Acidobacteria bacterium]|nr:hypothetical protein [Acidobacteriota bacterium]
MKFSAIDPIIKAWIERHELFLYTEYKEAEVRSVVVVSNDARMFQIWIDPPTVDRVSVHAWDYKKRRRDWETNLAELNESLEAAIKVVRSWMIT